MGLTKIAILSGKGGTGKTMLSVNLAALCKNSYYIDCDVEEPNGHLFFRPNIFDSRDIFVKVPTVDNALCTGCKDCVNFCNFGALSYAKNLLIFEDVCHSCGGCRLVCPTQAIGEKDRKIGKIEKGISESVTTVTGTMDTGIASGVPIISEMLKYVSTITEGTAFIDCPPGSACIVMESIKDANYCVLVAEPTIFGAHNLAMVYELVQLFEKPCGVVLNKCEAGKNPSEDFCIANNLTILAKIPFDNNLGTLNSKGLIAVRQNINVGLFESILFAIKEASK